MKPKSFRKGWYVVYTRPRHEKKVSALVGELGGTSFLPLTKCLREWQGKKKFVSLPVFPSYVFVYLKGQDDFYRTLMIDGVIYFVRQGDIVATVPDDIVDNIRLVTAAGLDLEVSSHQFGEGSKLVFQHGPFTGMSCEVVRYSGKSKILVRANLLKRNILISVEPEYLMSASA